MIALRHIQKDLDEQKLTIQKSAEIVTQNINKIMEEKFRNLKEKYHNLEIKEENQEKRLYFLEKQARQKNNKEKLYLALENIRSNLLKNTLI